MTEEEFNVLRPSAFAIAYRMLGSVSEAEDAVQEGFVRLYRARAGGERIESPRAYLSTVVSRLSLDQLRSARVRRETYVGEWLPEPLLASADDDPARKAELADSLSLAFLVVLESLSPEQRAAFLLREVFDEPYERIAEIVGTSEQNARQLAARARRHACDPRPRQGGALADSGAARRRPLRRHHLAPRGGERATGCAALRPRAQADQRGDPRRRGRPDPGRERDRQPGQAAAPGAPGGRPGRAAAQAELDSSARGLELGRDHCDPMRVNQFARLIVIWTATRPVLGRGRLSWVRGDRGGTRAAPPGRSRDRRRSARAAAAPAARRRMIR